MTFISNMQKAEFEAFVKTTVREAILETKNNIKSISEKPSEYSTIKQVSEHFKVTPQTIHTSWIKKGVIKKYKFGGRSLLKIKEIEETMIEFPNLFRRVK